MSGVSVYSGALPEAVAREVEFYDVYRIKITASQKTPFTREEIETSPQVKTIYDNLRAEAVGRAIKKFPLEDKVLQDLRDVGLKILADVHIVSERRPEYFENDILCEDGKPSPKLEVLIEAVGYRKRD